MTPQTCLPSNVTVTPNEASIPIARLPPELLLLTLQFAMNPNEFHADRIFYTITYSHVCTSWRGLLLGAPDLWTLVDLQYPHIAREFCSRSHPCPIRVCFVQTDANPGPEDAETAFGWLCAYIPRLERLHVSASSSIIRRILRLVRSASLPLTKIRDSLPSDARRGPTLSLGIRDQEIAQLNLGGFRGIDWAAFPESLVGLTSLVLTRLETQAFIPIPRLLRLIANCPQLKTLVLLAAILPWPAGAPDLPAVQLPELKSLEVAHGDPRAIVQLLEHLCFPSSTSITFHAHGVKDLSSLLPKDFGRHECAGSATIDDTPVTTVCRVSTTNIIIAMDRPSTSSALRFYIAPDDLSEVLRQLPALKLLVAGCTHLSAVSPLLKSPVSMSTWKSALMAMPTLRHIETGGAWAAGLLFALNAVTDQPPLPFPPLHSQFEIAAPALESVRLLERARTDAQTEQFLNDFAWVLEARRDYLGRKLSELVMETSRESARALMDALVPRFTAVVDRVEIRSRAAPASFDLSTPVPASHTAPELPSSSSSSSSSSASTSSGEHKRSSPEPQ
ncbi:hypothetical protein FOMPIDRAFT_1045324 [Fomitopsis schrenkii]|uniref:F-box domain-containing protein n=1 Tax=Fomitopsis schrenkii TaxID=2126942 RepID=S8EJG6_FOMSC|nr:hypothetical protein FOMPIDRAFT_1045324 [Fomitopsis schrenkii]